MTARRAVCWAVLPMLIPLLSARADAPATAPAEPAKLRVFAFVAVRSTKLASKATRAAVAKAAAAAVPAERFESLTVVREGTLKEAMTKAAGEKAQVFLSIAVGAPKRVSYTRRVPVRFGGRRRGIRMSQPFYTLRCPVSVALSISGGVLWREVRSARITSADAAGAEDELATDDADISKAWLKAVDTTVRAACEKVLRDHFFRNVKLKAVEMEPIEAEGDDDDDRDVPQTVVRIELLNRSHSRILDATVTVERYDAQFKRWEPVGAPRGFARWFRRRFGRTTDPTKLSWPIPAAVDPGEKALSEDRPVTEAVYNEMSRQKCRLVLHATPAVWTLRPPSFPARIKPARLPPGG